MIHFYDIVSQISEMLLAPYRINGGLEAGKRMNE
jgi:hypothetical protein